jgi:hypothetical protein
MSNMDLCLVLFPEPSKDLGRSYEKGYSYVKQLFSVLPGTETGPCIHARKL